MSDRLDRAIIIGASSGIGRAIASELAERGGRIALLSRDEQSLQNLAGTLRENAEAIEVFSHDVCNRQEIPALFDRVVQTLGGLDVIFYVAGYMPQVEEGAFDVEEDIRAFDINILGAIAWLNQAAQRFHQVRHGTIVGISSIAGERGRKGNTAYSASKAALSTYLESLRNRLAERNIDVVTIKPGFVDTAMLGDRRDELPWVISPEAAARQIIDAATSGPVVRYVPRRWGAVAAVVRSIPSVIFRRLSI